MLDGLKKFKEFLRENQFNIPYVKEVFLKDKHLYHYAYFVFSDNDEKFYTARYWQKYEVDNSIERIINNFEVDIRDDSRRDNYEKIFINFIINTFNNLNLSVGVV